MGRNQDSQKEKAGISHYTYCQIKLQTLIQENQKPSLLITSLSCSSLTFFKFFGMPVLIYKYIRDFISVQTSSRKDYDVSAKLAEIIK